MIIIDIIIMYTIKLPATTEVGGLSVFIKIQPVAYYKYFNLIDCMKLWFWFNI